VQEIAHGNDIKPLPPLFCLFVSLLPFMLFLSSSSKAPHTQNSKHTHAHAQKNSKPHKTQRAQKPQIKTHNKNMKKEKK